MNVPKLSSEVQTRIVTREYAKAAAPNSFFFWKRFWGLSRERACLDRQSSMRPIGERRKGEVCQCTRGTERSSWIRLARPSGPGIPFFPRCSADLEGSIAAQALQVAIQEARGVEPWTCPLPKTGASKALGKEKAVREGLLKDQESSPKCAPASESGPKGKAGPALKERLEETTKSLREQMQKAVVFVGP